MTANCEHRVISATKVRHETWRARCDACQAVGPTARSGHLATKAFRRIHRPPKVGAPADWREQLVAARRTPTADGETAIAAAEARGLHLTTVLKRLRAAGVVLPRYRVGARIPTTVLDRVLAGVQPRPGRGGDRG